MRIRHWTPGLVVLASLVTLIFLANESDARKRRGRGKSSSRIEMTVGEVEYVTARYFQSVKVNPPIVKAILNRRRGTLTLIPKRRGKATIRIVIKRPGMRRKLKVEWKVVVR